RTAWRACWPAASTSSPPPCRRTRSVVAFRPLSARDALDSALVALRAARVDTPRLDAEVLLADALGVTREELLTRDPAAEGDALPPEIARHEPAEALFAGADGLEVLRALELRAPWVAVEHGASQGAAVRALLRGYDVTTHRDLAGHERVTVGARRR